MRVIEGDMTINCSRKHLDLNTVYTIQPVVKRV